MRLRGKVEARAVLGQVAHLLYVAKEQDYSGRSGARLARDIGSKGVSLLEQEMKIEGEDFSMDDWPRVFWVIRIFFATTAPGNDPSQELSWIKSMSEDEIHAAVLACLDHGVEFSTLCTIAQYSAKETRARTALGQVAVYGGVLSRWSQSDPSFSVVGPALKAYYPAGTEATGEAVEVAIAAIDETLVLLQHEAKVS